MSVEIITDDKGSFRTVRGEKTECLAFIEEARLRAVRFTAQLRANPLAVPLLAPARPPARSGLCLHCGEALCPPRTGGGCDLCHAALVFAWRAVKP